MRVLVACEFSNTVRDAFLRRGHDAYSCDLQCANHPNPNWRRHIQGDVRPLLRERWDLVVAHPPCTYLSRVSACRWTGKLGGALQPTAPLMQTAALFFLECLLANAPMVAVENPRQHTYARGLIGIDYTQEIEPYQFGHPYRKATWLWLEGLPPLVPTRVVDPAANWVVAHRDPRARSKTFQGIADAMAEQWG